MSIRRNSWRGGRHPRINNMSHWSFVGNRQILSFVWDFLFLIKVCLCVFILYIHWVNWSCPSVVHIFTLNSQSNKFLLYTGSVLINLHTESSVHGCKSLHVIHVSYSSLLYFMQKCNFFDRMYISATYLYFCIFLH